MVALTSDSDNKSNVGGAVMDAKFDIFKKLADDIIAGMERSGEAARLYDTWFMQPIPPDNINLRFPLSPEMKALFANPNDRASDD